MYYEEKNSDLKKLAETPSYKLNIDWNNIEKITGIKLHKNIKDFLSRITCKQIDFLTTFNFEKFIRTPENSVKYPQWLDEYSGKICQTDLEPLYSLDNIEREIKHRFEIGGNSNRFYIGSLFLNIGDVAILINNGNGNIEWCDFGYGYFEIYEENPFAIMSDDVQEFLDMLVLNEKTIYEVHKQNQHSEKTP